MGSLARPPNMLDDHARLRAAVEMAPQNLSVPTPQSLHDLQADDRLCLGRRHNDCLVLRFELPGGHAGPGRRSGRGNSSANMVQPYADAIETRWSSPAHAGVATPAASRGSACDQTGLDGEGIPVGVIVPVVFAACGHLLGFVPAEQPPDHGQAHVHPGRNTR